MEKALRYNEGKPEWSLVHFKSLEPIVRVLMYGAHKYSVFQNPETGEKIKGSDISREQVEKNGFILVSSGRDNWKNDMSLEQILDSSQRHHAAMIDGETHDESGELHAGHIFCNMMFWVYHYNKIQEDMEAEHNSLPF